MARNRKRETEEAEDTATEPENRAVKQKRRNAAKEAPSEGPAEQPADAERVAAEAEGQQDVGPGRREENAALARRRAAHFAHFQAEDEEEEDNAHTGGKNARTLGPWSSAIELVEARAAAAAAREGRRLSTSKADVGALEAMSVEWTPQRNYKLGERPTQRVGPLFQMAVELLMEHIEDVESLWGLPDVIKVPLAAAVCRQRKMSPAYVHLFTEGNPSEVVLPDCTQLDQDDLISALSPAATPRLERLDLNLCGRGFGNPIAIALATGGELSGLQVLRLGGAYRLMDAGLEALLRVTPQLIELHLPQCSRLQGPSLERLPSLTPRLKVLSLADCRGLGGASLRSILCGPANLAALEALTLDGIAELDDQLLSELCLSLPRLARLSISFCSLVSDVGLRGIAAGCGERLTELRVDEVAKLSDAGLAAIAESCPNLQVLSIQRCQKVSDLGLAGIASLGTLRVLGANKITNLGPLTIKALISTCSEKLEEADFSWCRGISSNALGLLVDSCPNLRRLTLFGCSQIGKEFLHGHSRDELLVIGATAQRSSAPEGAKLKLLEEEDYGEEGGAEGGES